MTTDNWLGGIHTFTNARYWSAGVPGVSSDILITEGDVLVTSPFAVNWFQNKVGGTISVSDAGSCTVTQQSINSGVLDIDTTSRDGGSNLSIGGALLNYNRLQIGAADGSLSISDSVTVAAVISDYHGPKVTSAIALYGGASTQATLDVRDAAGFGTAGVLTGSLMLSGDALLEFGGTDQITTIAKGAGVTLTGTAAFIADAGLGLTTNSALTGLSTIDGFLRLDGGAAVSTNVSLTLASDAALELDPGGLFQASGAVLDRGTIELDDAQFATTTTQVSDIYGAVNAIDGSRFATNGSLVVVGGSVDSGLEVENESQMSIGGSLTIGRGDALHNGLNTAFVDVSPYVESGMASGIAIGGALIVHQGGVLLEGSYFDEGATETVSAASLTNAGTIDLNGDGTYRTHPAIGAKLLISGRFENDGLISVDGDLEEVKGAVTGSGTISLIDGGDVQFDVGVAAGQTVSFANPGDDGTLALKMPAAFGGSLAKFAGGDTVDVSGFGAGTTVAYTPNADGSGGTLRIANGSATADLTFVGSYATSEFHVAAGSSGDSLITYTPPSSS